MKSLLQNKNTAYFIFMTIILIFFFQDKVFGGEVGIYPKESVRFSDNCSALACFRGTIESGDSNKLKNVINNYKSKAPKSGCILPGFTLILGSNGGDVREAIKMGDLVRKEKLTVNVHKSGCSSSCVFILAGGIDRLADDHTVGIHRPYFVELKTKSELEARKARESLITDIKSYLVRVDVSLALLDAMLSIPPNQIKTLSSEELIAYRLVGRDATDEEMRVANIAKYYGITSAEWRFRDAKRDQACDTTDYDCIEPIMWGLPRKEYLKRNAEVRRACKGIGDEATWARCSRRIMINSRE